MATRARYASRVGEIALGVFRGSLGLRPFRRVSSPKRLPQTAGRVGIKMHRKLTDRTSRSYADAGSYFSTFGCLRNDVVRVPTRSATSEGHKGVVGLELFQYQGNRITNGDRTYLAGCGPSANWN